MKVKFVKMGMDIDETKNHRIRSIFPTSDDKYLFIEISQGTRPDIRYTNLNTKEYQIKYPNEHYIFINNCFRIDNPEEHYNNYSPEFKDYNGQPFYELDYTNANIIQLLQRLNKDISNIELVDEYFLDKYCEEKGFFRLYDYRLKHSYEPIEIIWSNLGLSDKSKVKFLYTFFDAHGNEYSKKLERYEENSDLFKKYDNGKLKTLFEEYISKVYSKYPNDELKNNYLSDLVALINDNNDSKTMENKEDLYDIDY